MLTFIQFSLSI